MATMPAGNLIGGNLVTPGGPSGLSKSEIAPNLLLSQLSPYLESLTPYFGQVATHCYHPDTLNATKTQLMARSYHIASADISLIQLRYDNWYGFEQLPGGAATVTSSIEYPEGTLTQITFSGSATGNMADGGYVVSDRVPVAIPRGAAFWVRTYYQNAAGIIFKSKTNQTNNAFGEGLNYGASGIADQTMVSNFSYVFWGNLYGPTAIIGLTNKPSVLILGDSRVAGTGDTLAPIAGTTEYGMISPSLFPNVAFINASMSGERVSTFITTHARRATLGVYCTHILCELGINDLTASRTAAQVLADHQTISGYFPGKRYYLTTIPPKSASTDSWATLEKQTPDATSNAQRISFNGTLRSALPSFATGYFECADVLESARNSGIWKVPAYTADGLHPTSAGYQLVTDSNVIDDALIVRYP